MWLWLLGFLVGDEVENAALDGVEGIAVPLDLGPPFRQHVQHDAAVGQGGDALHEVGVGGGVPHAVDQRETWCWMLAQENKIRTRKTPAQDPGKGMNGGKG